MSLFNILPEESLAKSFPTEPFLSAYSVGSRIALYYSTVWRPRYYFSSISRRRDKWADCSEFEINNLLLCRHSREIRNDPRVQLSLVVCSNVVSWMVEKCHEADCLPTHRHPRRNFKGHPNPPTPIIFALNASPQQAFSVKQSINVKQEASFVRNCYFGTCCLPESRSGSGGIRACRRTKMSRRESLTS